MADTGPHFVIVCQLWRGVLGGPIETSRGPIGTYWLGFTLVHKVHAYTHVHAQDSACAYVCSMRVHVQVLHDVHAFFSPLNLFS